MSSLQTIQKTFRVFQILTKIAFIVSIVIAAVITACLGAERSGDVSNLPGVVTGVVLILVSLIFRYGAELEKKARPQLSSGEK